MLLLLAACTGPAGDKPNNTDVEVVDTGDSTVEAQSWCAEQGYTLRAWQDASDSDELYATVADITVETTEGPVVLSELHDGCNTMLFIPNEPAQVSFGEPIWNTKKDVRDLFDTLPENTHVFFLVSGQMNSDDRDATLADLKDKVDAVTESSASHWGPRVHYVSERAKNVDGWIGDHFTSPGWGVAVDRFQRLRYIGSFADPERYNSSYGWFEGNLAMAASEARLYNMESNREDALDPDATIINVFDSERVAGSTYVDVTMPTADQMSDYDTLEIDLYMGCEGSGEFGYCPAWDYMAYLFICAWPGSENPYADTACQPYEAEVKGSCSDDVDTECTSDDDCAPTDTGASTAECVGYSAAVAAETHTGTCNEADGTTHDGTYTCEEDGAGFADLSCGCDTELGRWITTYHREGRWVHDVSELIPMLDDGVDHQFRFATTGPYELDLDLRLSNTGKAERAQELHYLYDGLSIRSGGYNESYQELEVDIPADAVKVELFTVTTGHGMSSPGNCAEFCDLHHEWTINDTDAIVLDQPWVGDTFGCQAQVDEQTIPNQYGTWWYGRGGWCPGKQVDPVVTDITDRVTPGETATVWYQNFFNGAEYSGDNWSHTIMNSWIVVSR